MEFWCNLTLPSRNFVGLMTLFFKNFLTTYLIIAVDDLAQYCLALC